MTPILTVGHSTRPVAELIDLLHGHGIDTLVDIRRFPGSRRYPQYGREALAAAVAVAGIDYIHEPRLGGRRPARPDSPNTYWRNAGFRGYADYMATPEFGAGLDALLQAAAARSVAMMCAEAVPWRCHRQLVADALVARGHRVAHIVGPGPAQPHVLNPAVEVANSGVLTYASEGGQSRLFDGA